MSWCYLFIVVVVKYSLSQTESSIKYLLQNYENYQRTHRGIHYTCAIRCGDRFVEKIYLLIIQQTEKCLLSDPPSSAATETYILFAR